MSKLYAIGVGPGNSQYLTLKAAQILSKADIIFSPQSEEKKDSLAYTICQEYINHRAEIVNLIFPMTQDKKVLQNFWQRAVQTIKEKMQNKGTGAFVTLGDPSIYSTYSYIINELKNSNLKIKTIPGITAFTASAAALNMSLVERKEKLALLPATDTSAIENAIENFETIVLYKVNRNLAKITKLLKEKELLEKSYLISSISSDKEHIQQLNNLEEKERGYFSTLIIKKSP